MSTFNMSVSVGFSLLALRALLSVFTLDVDDLPASRRRESSEERINLHRLAVGMFFGCLIGGRAGRKEMTKRELRKTAWSERPTTAKPPIGLVTGEKCQRLAKFL